MTGPDVVKCLPLEEVIDLSLLVHRAATAAGIDPVKARRFLDELVALPNDAAARILADRQHDRIRRANAVNRKVRNTRSR